MSGIHYDSIRAGATYRALAERHGSPLLVLDAAKLRATYDACQRALPNVTLFYAVKSLPDPEVVRVLAQHGANFDLASSGEVALVQSLGVEGRRTIHTHPIKTDRSIRDALRFGCTTFVVDNPYELSKLVRYRHRIALLLRVSFRNPTAKVDLSKKFGCDPSDVPALLAQAESLGLHVKGLSFHVGSQCANADSHVAAIEACAELMASSQGIHPMSVLDIGGGFPVDYGDPSTNHGADMAAFCAPIRAALARLPSSIEVFAEPGRCISAPPVSLICSVVGKAERDGRMWYYLDEGVYGAFSGQVYDGAMFPLTFFGGAPTQTGSVLTGPTCDSFDVVRDDIETPDLGIGDLIIAKRIGAYAAASATQFNSLPTTRMVVLDDDPLDAVASEAN